MGFSSSPRRVTKSEFKKVRNRLSVMAGMTHDELDHLELLLDSSMNEKRKEDQGIDSDEVDQFVAKLKHPKFKHNHTFSDAQIEHIHETLRKHL